MIKRPTIMVLGASIALLLSACSSTNNDSTAQYQDGSNKGYIAGDGTVAEWPQESRGEPVRYSGNTDAGSFVTHDDFIGDVVVVNFWYAACAPCRAEAPDLSELSQTFSDDDVKFLGVNVRDKLATAQAFASKYGIEYPSIIDTDSGSAAIGFASTVPANAVPTTMVLDRDGRVAARILGQFDKSILSTLIRDALSESPQ